MSVYRTIGPLVNISFKVDIFPMKNNIVVTDAVNDVTYSRKSVNTCTCVVITLLLHDVIHWKTVTSYDKQIFLKLFVS